MEIMKLLPAGRSIFGAAQASEDYEREELTWTIS
jgi:hypothetical protein